MSAKLCAAGASSLHFSILRRRSSAGTSIVSSSGERLNGSVRSPSRCRRMVARSTTCPDPGSVTGSLITVCMMGSTNSSGMERASSTSRKRSTSSRVARTRRTKSRSRASTTGEDFSFKDSPSDDFSELSGSPEVSFSSPGKEKWSVQGKSLRNSSCATSALDRASSAAMDSTHKKVVLSVSVTSSNSPEVSLALLPSVF
mmetsp:Transcript_10128/g.42594  ORF Transcript_10128/g.42594 Transcript_10128/m.42594 type:complete len:200 (+) Transcript_10128:65-664(+)